MAKNLAGPIDLRGRAARGGAFAAGDMEAEVALQAAHRLLDRAAGRGRDAARMPVEAERATERLEPVWIGEPIEHPARTVLGDEMGQHLARQLHHAPEQPGRRFPRVQRQVGQPDPSRAKAHRATLAEICCAIPLHLGQAAAYAASRASS